MDYVAAEEIGIESVVDQPPRLPVLESYPISNVEINRLKLDGSPRTAGEDPEHIRALADVNDSLPPIVVHRRTMRVIDGMHRVRAANLAGRRTIPARLLDCDETVAFLLAVKSNVTHGLPLTLGDRKAAARIIISRHPNWSDRVVAAATGLSDHGVSNLRDGATPNSAQSHSRLGRDGRSRPVNSASRRLEAAAIFADRPTAGLREVARATGLSPATIRDVRKRIARGDDPVPPRYREAFKDPRHESQPGQAESSAAKPFRAPAGLPQRAAATLADREELLARLMNDPSVRFSANGRYTLRWLYHYTVLPQGLDALRDKIPDHWTPLVATLARSCATAWADLADYLDHRASDTPA